MTQFSDVSSMPTNTKLKGGEYHAAKFMDTLWMQRQRGFASA
jgi:hypothetical protein